jgi:hypothetical protein
VIYTVKNIKTLVDSLNLDSSYKIITIEPINGRTYFIGRNDHKGPKNIIGCADMDKVCDWMNSQLAEASKEALAS